MTAAKNRQLLKQLFCAALLLLGSISTAFARDDIRVGMQLEPPALDPTITAAAAAGEITYCNIFEGLTVVNGDGKVAPRLAKSWTLSDGGLDYTFTLHSGVRFHDGSPFNAHTAAFSLKRILAPDSKNPQKQWYDKIRSVKALDNSHLLIHLSKPDAFLPFALALPAAVMVHPDSEADNATHPIGTGPFRFVSWHTGDSITLKRNNYYWGKEPKLRKATFLFLPTSVGTENAIEEGLVDGLISVTRITSRFAVRPDYRMRPRKIENKMILAINNAHPPFNDLRVRRALSHAINRKKLSTVYGPQFHPELIGSHYSPSSPGYVDLVNRYPYDPARARELLAEAGVKEGTPVTLTLPPTDYGRYGGLMIASDLEAVGFRVELQPLSWKEWMDKVFTKKQYELTLIMHVEPMDLNIYARDNYYFNYDNTKFKAIWKQVVNARSQKRLYRLLGDAQRQITEDAVNVFLFMRPEENLMHRDLAGFWEKSSIPSFVLEDIYWKK